MQTVSERRGISRVKTSLPAWYRNDNHCFRKARTLDLGPHGARLVLNSSHQSFQLLLKIEESFVSALAERVWSKPLEDGSYMVGVQLKVIARGKDKIRIWHHVEERLAHADSREASRLMARRSGEWNHRVEAATSCPHSPHKNRPV